MVDHAWADPMVLFDVLAIQSAGAKVLLHTHSVFSMTLLKRELHDRFQCLPDVAAMADGVVALTPADACYWRQFSPRVFETRNPIDVADVPLNALGGRTMLWVGRNSPEKRPMDAIKAVMWIGDRVPGAKLIIMGGGFEHEAEMNWLKNVEYVGYHQDTEEIFRQADIFLCTSEYEGFSLTMAEAQARGIPCVTYDMPVSADFTGRRACGRADGGCGRAGKSGGGLAAGRIAPGGIGAGGAQERGAPLH